MNELDELLQERSNDPLFCFYIILKEDQLARVSEAIDYLDMIIEIEKRAIDNFSCWIVYIGGRSIFFERAMELSNVLQRMGFLI